MRIFVVKTTLIFSFPAPIQGASTKPFRLYFLASLRIVFTHRQCSSRPVEKAKMSMLALLTAYIALMTSVVNAANVKQTFCDGDSVSWDDCRHALVQKIFNRSTLPTQAEPNFIEVDHSYTMRGWPSPGNGVVPGEGVPTAYAWQNGLQKLTWTISSPFITLNSTVMYVACILVLTGLLRANLA